MKILVKVKPNAKEERVTKLDSLFEKLGEMKFIVAVKEPPVEGMANEAVVKAIAGYFKVSVSQVHIISGHTSRIKIIEISKIP